MTTNGIISVAWQEINCGRHRAGRRVDIHLQGPTMQVFDGEELLKTVLRTSDVVFLVMLDVPASPDV